MFLNEISALHPYSPWLLATPNGLNAVFASLPAYKREAYAGIYADVKALPQMVSVTGPRRVGKTTLLRQCIAQIVRTADNPLAQAQRVAYYSMDDPALSLPGADADAFFNQLVAVAANMAQDGSGLPVYLFLDEIQRFARWELYLKKFYDLNTPVRFVVSGSASGPIFRKSRESLLGRIKDFHVLPFSFREWAAVQQPSLTAAGLSALSEPFTPAWPPTNPVATPLEFVRWLSGLRFDDSANEGLEQFLFDGGFPEVWQLPTLLAKQDYLYHNQVERVIFEDLLIAADFRKPEMLRRFYLGLLKDPGRESNLSQVAKSLELDRRTIEGYFPLLEATDLVWRLHKHTSSKSTPKAGNFKTYLVDLAVRNAVMKLSQQQMAADAPLMGHYAENAVANHLRRWPGLVELGYWRHGPDELDFIADLGAIQIGIEVKFRNEVQQKDALKAAKLAQQLKCQACIVVTKHAWGAAELAKAQAASPVPLAVVPLAAFLMLF